MNKKNKIARYLGIFMLVTILMLFLAPDMVEARRGGGFGGRRSFGGSRSRSYNKPKSKSSFGNKRTTPKKSTPSSKAASRFGGQSMSNSKAYTSKYGTPRKSTPQRITKNGVSQNYVMHSYGGYGSGLMTGYMMGTTSMLWMMPFHPAFYYSRPYYVDNPDGTVGVYPPTFSWSKLFFTIIILAVIIYIIRAIIRARRGGGNRPSNQSSFS